jgi:hypothetical protein
MGLDFLDKTAKGFRRSCRKGFERLKSAYLFDPAVSPIQRSFLARTSDTTCFGPGQEVVLRADEGRITLYHDENPVGVCDAPPEAILQKIREAGVALGQLEAIHQFSGSVDVIVL